MAQTTTLTPSVKQALSGQPVADGQAKSTVKQLAAMLLGEQKKSERAAEKSATVMERAMDTGHAALNFVELETTAYLGGLAEGAWGDKVKPGGYDVRGIAGLLGELGGLFATWRGKKWASHVLAPSRGLLASMVVSNGISHGRKLADKPKATEESQISIPANAKPGDKIAFKKLDGSPGMGTVVQAADGSLQVAMQGSAPAPNANYREVQVPRALMSPGSRRRAQGGPRRGPPPSKYPRPRR